MPARVPTTTLDQDTVDRLSAGFHRCFSDLEADDGLFASHAFFDLLPPLWRFQLQGGAARFIDQLRSLSPDRPEIEVIRTIPTASGFVTEHVETRHTPDGVTVARRIHLCEVEDGQISAVTTYCNGPWDEALRARHAAEAPMIRP